MDGEIEEPSKAGFRMEPLHSGSVSFGRFESEDLSWERRSSFNHNKYLEEVEKCSKPGSVIEKKAYFEAHFKKKGILMPSTVEFCSEYQVLENGKLGEEDYDAYQVENQPQYDEIAIEDADYGDHDYEIEGGGFEYENYGSSYAKVNESHDEFELHGNSKGSECQREHLVSDLSSLEHQTGANVSVGGAAEYVELNQIETPNDELHLNSNGLEIQIKDHLDDDNPSHLSITTSNVDKVNKSHLQNHPKLETRIDYKFIKSRSKSQERAKEIQKNPCSNKSKASLKSQVRRERDNPQRAKPAKHPPHGHSPIRDIQVFEKEKLASCDSKQNSGNKREKEPKQKKVVESQSSGSKRVEHTSRHNQTAKPESRPAASTFSFKSGERAERRKEFYMKLEEKMNAKEAEMNQIQAKTQEKAEAEIKQFRKSLNFKATPMPSFYHISAKPTSTANKGVSPNTRPSKVQHSVMGPGSATAAKSHCLSKEATDFVSDSSKPAESFGAIDSAAMDCIENPSTYNAGYPEAVAKVGITKKEEKLKNTSGRHGSEKSKVPRDQSNEGKLNPRNGGEIARKNMKSVGISTSKMGRMPVGVTS